MALRKEILNEMDNQFLSTAELAQKANIDRTTLHKFLYDGTNISLSALINISLVLYPKTYNKVMCNWCLELEKPENMRLAMEFTALNGNLNILEEIVSKQSNEGRKNKQWAEVYTFFIRFRRENEHSTLISDIRNYKTTDPQLKLFLRLLEIYVIFQNKKYNVMFELAKDLESQINEIECPFIRESYLVRLCEMFAHGYLVKNDVKKARYYANVVFSSILCANLKASSVYIVGMSFLFENKAQCVSNLELSDKLLAEKLDEYNYPTYSNFAKVHWGDTPENMDFADKTYFYAKAGDKEKALECLEESYSETGQAVLKEYFRGLAEKDVTILWEVYGEYLSQGNLFFANLPRLALKELGESEAALNAYYKLLAA